MARRKWKGKKNSLPSRLQSVKNECKTYSCDQCEKSYKYQFSLKRHIMAKHTDKTELHLNQTFSDIKCNLCDQVFGSQELKAEHFDSIHMPLVRNWFSKKRDEGQGLKSKFECKICERKFLFENSLDVHMRTRCIKEVKACSSPEVRVNEVCEELDTQKSYVEVEDEYSVNATSGPARQLTKLLVFHDNEPATGTHLLMNSQSKLVANEIVEIVLNCVMEVHIDKISEDFFVVDENGEDIENIEKDLQYSQSDKSSMINFSSGIGFEGLTSETLLESIRKSSKRRLIVEKESIKGAEAVAVKISKRISCPFITSAPYCTFHRRAGHDAGGGQEGGGEGGGEGEQAL